LYGVNYIQRCLYSKNRSFLYTKENIMWTTPAATEMRFGFEVTMYVMNK
jgi:pyrroloquinoline quinone biosynthesis protein A